MINKHFTKNLLPVLVLLLAIASCKKDSKNPPPTPVVPIATPTKLGLFEAKSTDGVNKLLFMPIKTVGTQAVDYDLIFDTGSGGMVLDATDIIPAAMITSSGFTITGDSTVVNGITITKQASVIEYGDDDASSTKVYGNLAYALVTMGGTDGTITIKRLPFFLYYKGVDSKGNIQEKHFFDILGVSPEYDLTFANNAYITSPLSYFDPGNGLTKGFKMAALGTSNFSTNGTFVSGALTLGLTAADLSSSSGFINSTLSFYQGVGYLPIIPATGFYNVKSFSSYVLFDTGTEPYSYIQDSSASPPAQTLLPSPSTVSLTTASGFLYNYTTSATENLTYVENPGTSGADVSIFSIEFFLTNSYMLDYTNNKMGVKNN